jgi:hypothetical protein
METLKNVFVKVSRHRLAFRARKLLTGSGKVLFDKEGKDAAARLPQEWSEVPD